MGPGDSPDLWSVHIAFLLGFEIIRRQWLRSKADARPFTQPADQDGSRKAKDRARFETASLPPLTGRARSRRIQAGDTDGARQRTPPRIQPGPLSAVDEFDQTCYCVHYLARHRKGGAIEKARDGRIPQFHNSAIAPSNAERDSGFGGVTSEFFYTCKCYGPPRRRFATMVAVVGCRGRAARRWGMGGTRRNRRRPKTG